MAQAVINVGKTGQLAQVKYLFEVAKIFPGPADGSEATADEDSLAKTLLEQLHLPTVPVTLGEDGEVVIPVQRGSEGAQGTSAQEGEGEASESQN